MFIGADVTAAVTTVPLQLSQAAEAYDDAAFRLRGVLAKLPEYQGQLDRVEEVHWDSMASDAFRSVLQLLRLPAKLMIVELSALAAEASSIADDLRHYAQQAQNLISLMLSVTASVPLLDMAWGAAAEQFEQVWQQATSALGGDAAHFVEFIDRHGGIPHILEQGVRQAVLPW
ncbi:hypothetical protein [Nesterenkonia muleiensis]|uniref:hypothetical protein n=1 Tax=Nesterenkonia muleiensis TaxID=2282648 RepID=UPI000E7474AB|nr:hypothetical protein [Nesterenkonia muleiensis]